MSKFKTGDHVRIKTKDEILRAPRAEYTDYDYIFQSRNGLGFVEEMFKYCGKDFVLKRQSVATTTRWVGEGEGVGGYWRDEDWLELYEDPSAVSNLNFNLEELL